MSEDLVNQIRQFMNLATPLETFVAQYIDCYRSERNYGRLLEDRDNVCEFLSSAFCVVDMYNPLETRREYEFDELKLRLELKKLADELAIEL